MRHKKALGKLGRSPSHRRATLRNMATSLILHDQIETTLPRAKELKRVADKLVTLGKTDSLHRRRQAMSFLMPVDRRANGDAQKWTAVHKLFEEIAPRFAERNGGYTRVIRTRKRDGDKAQMAVIAFVTEEVEKKAPKRKRRVVKKAPAETTAVEGEVSAEESANETAVSE